MVTGQPDLFGTRQEILPEGLRLGADMVSRGVEAELIARIDDAGLSPFRFHGWLGKRLTASFGHSYDFERGRLSVAEPIPPWLFFVRERLARHFGLGSECLVQALVIRYDPGAGIGWHRDRPQFEHVVGLSLGNPVELRLRRRLADGRFERRAIRLEPRSAYCLTGPVRWEWQHEIQPVRKTRWSVTFRSLRASAVPPDLPGC